MKKISDRAMRSMTTRCQNQAKELEKKLPDLYKQRDFLINGLRFLYSFRDFDKRGIQDFEKIYQARTETMIKITELDLRIKEICIEHMNLVQKANEYFKTWQSQQNEIVEEGFIISNTKTN